MQPRVRVRDVAAGKWLGILSNFGLTDRQLSGRHCPCPACGGKDRFRFDDKDGRGTWYCSHCGAGDGVDLVKRIRDCDFRTAAVEIERLAGAVQPLRRPRHPDDEAKKIEALRTAWSESARLVNGDEASRYLAGRGLAPVQSDSLRLHPSLPYQDGGQFFGRYPALMARVVAADGTGATLHRTYLLDGKKAPVQTPRKLMPGRPIAGAAIRLFPAAESIGIAEGIETALAAAELFGISVWACVSAHGVATFDPPADVRRVTIFGDHDENFTGQAAAFECAKRLALRGIATVVRIPEAPGDWLDFLVSRIRKGST